MVYKGTKELQRRLQAVGRLRNQNGWWGGRTVQVIEGIRAGR